MQLPQPLVQRVSETPQIYVAYPGSHFLRANVILVQTHHRRLISSFFRMPDFDIEYTDLQKRQNCTYVLFGCSVLRTYLQIFIILFNSLVGGLSYYDRVYNVKIFAYLAQYVKGRIFRKKTYFVAYTKNRNMSKEGIQTLLTVCDWDYNRFLL